MEDHWNSLGFVGFVAFVAFVAFVVGFFQQEPRRQNEPLPLGAGQENCQVDFFEPPSSPRTPRKKQEGGGGSVCPPQSEFKTPPSKKSSSKPKASGVPIGKEKPGECCAVTREKGGVGYFLFWTKN